MATQQAVQSDRFIYSDTQPVENVGDGIRRQFLGYNEDLMAVRIWFETGAAGPAHRHHHTQSCYVESGRFLITVDGEESELTAGDGFFVKPNELHGAVCLEAGVLLDMFNPVRGDFLGLEGA